MPPRANSHSARGISIPFFPKNYYTIPDNIFNMPSPLSNNKLSFPSSATGLCCAKNPTSRNNNVRPGKIYALSAMALRLGRAKSYCTAVRGFCRLKCTLKMQRNVRTRKFTVNVRKNRAQQRRMQLIATNPYCSMLLLNVPQRRHCDTNKRFGRPLGGRQTRKGSGLGPSEVLLY